MVRQFTGNSLQWLVVETQIWQPVVEHRPPAHLVLRDLASSRRKLTATHTNSNTQTHTHTHSLSLSAQAKEGNIHGLALCAGTFIASARLSRGSRFGAE